ncbi:hypothetical protein OCU04_007592 [Sclerotinia nivalis]|uniref:Uncharacterized protein n=1 Tax=Sclerotinia nivalis TaxID=352851 RepID=A0A9X0AK04_9HELO|nr:hypothetical protein OCU04_007592 [Sclerotinia nivalis]
MPHIENHYCTTILLNTIPDYQQLIVSASASPLLRNGSHYSTSQSTNNQFNSVRRQTNGNERQFVPSPHLTYQLQPPAYANLQVSPYRFTPEEINYSVARKQTFPDISACFEKRFCCINLF